MKIYFIILMVLISACDDQKRETPLKVQYLLDPVVTDVVLGFGEGLVDSIDFFLDYRRIMHPPFSLDTTLAKGVKEFVLSVPLETPILARLRVGDHWDHIYLVPGQTIHATFDPSKEIQHRIDVTRSEELKEINEYYDSRIALLNVSREILQAYQLYFPISDPSDASKQYDSIALLQYDLLHQFSERLPDWFVHLEEKEIKYIGEVFKSGVITYRILKDNSFFGDDYSVFDLSWDLNDTVGMFTSFYSWSLGELAKLKYCPEDCYDDNLEVRLPILNSVILKMAETIQHPDIRQIFLAQNLMRIYNSSHSSPDSLVLEYERRLEQPYLDLVSIYKNPGLEGQEATSFYLADEYGIFYTLDNWQGEVVLLNFWFVGCKPCELELPYEKSLVEELKGEKFKLVNVCTNTPEKAWKEYVDEHEMPGINLYAKGNWGKKLTDAYRVTAFPTYVLIDKNGLIVLDKAPRPSGDLLIDEIKRRLD